MYEYKTLMPDDYFTKTSYYYKYEYTKQTHGFVITWYVFVYWQYVIIQYRLKEARPLLLLTIRSFKFTFKLVTWSLITLFGSEDRIINVKNTYSLFLQFKFVLTLLKLFSKAEKANGNCVLYEYFNWLIALE